MNRWPALIVLSLFGSSTALATDVGRFANVAGVVSSYKPEAPEVALTPAIGTAVALGEREETGPASSAKILIGDGGGLISLGPNTRFSVDQQAVDQNSGAKESIFGIVAGKVRVFVSRFWSDRPTVKVDSPTAVVAIKGSEVALEAFSDKRLTVSVLGGSASVTLKGDGRSIDLESGDMLKIDASGKPVGAPTKLAAGAAAALRAATDVGLGEMPVLLTNLPGLAPPGAMTFQDSVERGGVAMRHVIQGESLASNGPTWSDPAGAASVPPVDCNCGPQGAQ